jgi:hypothetical protein
MLRLKTQTLAAALMTFLVWGLLAPQEPVIAQEGRGGQAGEFLRFGVGARALGMGRAFTSLADDASAVYWNPAGIGLLDQTGLAFMHSQLFLDTRYQFLGLMHPLSNAVKSKWNHTVGFGYIDLSAENFEEVDDFNEVIGSFSTRDYAIMIPYSLNLMNTWGNFNFGIKPQLIRQTISGESGGTWGIDLGVVYQPLSPRRELLGLGLVPLKYLMPWRLGINYRMLGSADLGNSSTDYPNSLNVGVSNVAFEDILDLLWPFGDPFASKPVKVIFAYEFEKVFSSGRTAEHHLGSEVRWRPLNSIVLSGRFGYHLARASTENKLSWGFGIRSDPDWLTQAPFIKGLEVDLSQINHPQLDNAFQVYFTLKIGDWKNNVRNVRKGSVWKADGSAAIEKPVLLQYLSEYSNDDRVVEELQGLDIAYKDTVAAALSYYADAADDKWLTDRYDDFIGGPRKIDKKLEKIWPTITCATDHQQFEAIRSGYEEYRGDLAKKIYFKSLKWYLRVLLILGETSQVQQLVESEYADQFRESAAERNYFLAYSTANRDPQYAQAVVDGGIPTDENVRITRRYQPYETLALVLRRAVLETGISNNSVDLNALLDSNSQEAYISHVAEYDPLFSICDGIIADDLMFVAAYQKARVLNDAKSIRNLFLPIVLELPHSDLGKVISLKLRDLSLVRDDAIDTRTIFEELWQRYESLLLSNQALDVANLLKSGPIRVREESTRRR